MKFVGIILRIKSFWTAFALGVIFVSIFADATLFCTPSHKTKPVEISALRPAEKFIADLSSDDYAVYSAVLKQIRSSGTWGVVGELAVDADWNDSQYVRSEHFNLSDHALNDYRLKNRVVRKLQSRYEFGNIATLLSADEEDRLFPKGGAGWDKFYREYPRARGIIYFSSVGFNKNKDEALVRVNFQSGYWGGGKDFYILKRVEGTWLVEKDSGDRFSR